MLTIYQECKSINVIYVEFDRQMLDPFRERIEFAFKIHLHHDLPMSSETTLQNYFLGGKDSEELTLEATLATERAHLEAMETIKRMEAQIQRYVSSKTESAAATKSTKR